MRIAKQFRDIVEAELRKRGWTRARFAEELDVHPSMVSNYLNGNVSPGSDVIDRFFQALELEPDLRANHAKELTRSA